MSHVNRITEFNVPHARNCAFPIHVRWVAGIYDQHGMRAAMLRSVSCRDSADLDLDAEARHLATFYPSNRVYLWLDLSVSPTEHLRDMPPANGSSEVPLR